MKTTIYLIRHAESPYAEGQERARGLSEQGKADAERIRTILQKKPIDLLFSSPYARAIHTLQPLADELHKEIVLVEGLRERGIGDIADMSFTNAKRSVYEDFSVAFEGGESSIEAQARGIRELKLFLEKYAGSTLAIGTHGDIMTLMMNYFDSQYGFEFWQSTTMPDIYRLDFVGKELMEITREWGTNRQ
ncbi:histidine phosphatase family protein [Paenibacillus sp. BAC0078]